MDDSTIDSWSDDIESILENISYNCGILSLHYQMAYESNSYRLHFFKIPTIFLSGLNGLSALVLSVYIGQQYTSLTNALVSWLISLLTSIEIYLSFEKSKDANNKSYKNYRLLNIKIQSVLKLTPKNRSMDGMTFYLQIINEYSSLFETSKNDQQGFEDKFLNLKTVDTRNSLC
jgi:hypothetical protein